MRPKTALRTRDALDQLRLDHDLIRRLLREYDGVRLIEGCGPERKAEIVERLCDALCLNALIEEEIFYPVVRPALDGAVLAQAALCDHARLRRLIARVDEMEPGDPGYDDAVVDIGDCVLPSLDDAQTVLFVGVRMTGLDTAALGEQMARRRRAQQQQDFTRIGLPRSESTVVVGSWPPACHLSLA
jgi:hypothetical protein